MTDRGVGLDRSGVPLNVRRLMYQSLIWSSDLRNDPSSLRAPLDAENLERMANALVYGMRRNVELGGDFLRRQELVDEKEAIELGGSQAGDSLGHDVRRARA